MPVERDLSCLSEVEEGRRTFVAESGMGIPLHYGSILPLDVPSPAAIPGPVKPGGCPPPLMTCAV